MKCGNKLCKYNDDYYRDNCRNTEHAELASQCMKNNFNHYEPADLPEAGASAERISSVVRCCQNSEDILKETIENALYSTGNFTIEQCTDLAEGLILFIRDSFKNKSAIAHNE